MESKCFWVVPKIYKCTNMKYILNVLWIVLILSCNNKNLPEENSIKVPVDLNSTEKKLNLTNCFDSVETIKLVAPEDEIIGIIKKVLFEDEKVYLLSDKQKTVFIFDDKGSFLRKINYVGSGPEEYITAKNFFLMNDLIGIVDEMSSMILFYDQAGKFVKKIKHDLIFRDIIPLGEIFLCYTPDKMSKNPYGLWEMSANGSFKKNIFEPEKHYLNVNGPWFSLYRNKENNIGAYCTNINKIYYLNTEDSVYCSFEFVPNKKTLAFFNNSKTEREITEVYYDNICTIDANDWIYSMWGETENFELVHSLYSKSAMKSESFKEFNIDMEGVKGLGYLVFSNRNNAMVTIIHDDEVPEFSPEENGVVNGNSLHLQIFHFKDQSER